MWVFLLFGLRAHKSLSDKCDRQPDTHAHSNAQSGRGQREREFGQSKQQTIALSLHFHCVRVSSALIARLPASAAAAADSPPVSCKRASIWSLAVAAVAGCCGSSCLLGDDVVVVCSVKRGSARVACK